MKFIMRLCLLIIVLKVIMTKRKSINFYFLAPYQHFAIHPSNEYVFILLSIGLIYVFKIKTGELRGKISIPKFSNRIINLIYFFNE